MNNISRAKAAECHMIAITCRGIIALFNSNYSTRDVSDYMSTYISDLKKYDEDLALTVEQMYAQQKIDKLVEICEQHANENELIVKQVLTGTSNLDVHTYDKTMQETSKYVESLRATEHDDFYC